MMMMMMMTRTTVLLTIIICFKRFPAHDDLDTCTTSHHASHCQQLAPAHLPHAAFVLNNVDLVAKPT